MTSHLGLTSLWAEVDNKKVENKWAYIFREWSVRKETRHCETTKNYKVVR